MNNNLILASASPRRQELLKLLVPAFEIFPAAIDEHSVERAFGGGRISDLVRQLSEQKALAVSRVFPEALVMGADTLVDLDGQLISKPTSAAHARELLRQLRGREELIHTGLTLARGGVVLGGSVTTSTLKMTDFSDAAMDAYITTGRGMDKAGGYGIQDPEHDFIEWYEGCFNNIVGLPLCAVRELLKPFAETLSLTPEGVGEECDPGGGRSGMQLNILAISK